MICPNCRNTSSPKKVLRTWMNKDGNVKRKRRCKFCKKTFHTIELVTANRIYTKLSQRE